MSDNKLMPLPENSGKDDSNSQPLPPTVRHELETKFGQNLSDVRVYEGHQATLLQARAFSQGNDICFAPGEYAPHSEPGNRLIAHEVSHVVQQRSGVQNNEIPKGMVQVGDNRNSNE
jgi:predicted metalloprotease